LIFGFSQIDVLCGTLCDLSKYLERKSSAPTNPPFFNKSSKPETKKPSSSYRIILPLAMIGNLKVTS
jgi:hypothetical protein